MSDSRRQSPTTLLSVIAWSLALIAAPGCGGGGGGGGTSTARLEGTLTVPNLALVAGRIVRDAECNDVAGQAQDVGPFALAGDREGSDAFALVGTVGGDDRRDVFRVQLDAGRTVRVQATPGVRVEVFDAALGSCAAALPADSAVSLWAERPATVDIVVAASASGSTYRVDVQGTGGAPLAARLPLSPQAANAPSSLQSGYLGADCEMVPGEVIVMHDEAALATATQHLSSIGLEAAAPVPGPIQRYRVATPVAPMQSSGMSAALLTALAAHRAAQVAGVRGASPNYVYRAFQTTQTPNDRLFSLQWHYAAINVPQAWALFSGIPGSASVIVAIVDTGMVLGHPDFNGRLVAGYDMISDAARALDGDGIDANPDDPGDNAGTSLPSSFHGTHVGGTVGATTNNSDGVAGMDWSCKLMPIRALGRGGSGTLEDIAQGIRYAAGLSNASGTLPPQRCDVMNLSLGGPGFSTVLESACQQASAAGVLLVAAAGNDNSSTPNYPASTDVCLSVGAIRFDSARAPYSNFASTVDVVAPGGDTSVDQNEDGQPDGVLSCLAADGNPRQVGFGFLQGTSMACPHVAGLAALVKAAKPTAPASELRSLIEGNTVSRGSSTRIVDAFRAVQAAQGTSAPNPVLSIAPGNLGIQNTETTATVALSNIGNPTLLSLNPPSIAYTTASGWATATLEGTASSTISHPTLRITVNRTGLADGRYDARVTLTSSTPNVAAAQLPVTLFVGVTQPTNDTIFVVVFGETDLANGGQAQTTAAAGFAWSIPQVTPGRYYLVAGTDRDNDDEIGDDGELFGFWPSNDSPLILEIAANQPVVSGLNFTVALQNVQQSVGARRLPPFRITPRPRTNATTPVRAPAPVARPVFIPYPG